MVIEGMIAGAVLIMVGFFLGCVFMVMIAAARRSNDDG